MRPVKQPQQGGRAQQGRRAGPEITPFSPPARPKFNHQYTSDRLREGLERPLSFSMASNIRKDRKSIFRELGLDAYETPEVVLTKSSTEGELPELMQQASASTDHTAGPRRRDSRWTDGAASPRLQRTPSRSPTRSSDEKPWYAKLAGGRRPGPKTVASAQSPIVYSLWRLVKVILLIAFLVPALVMATVTRRLRAKTRAPV